MGHGICRSMYDPCGGEDAIRCNNGLALLRQLGREQLPVAVRHIEVREEKATLRPDSSCSRLCMRRWCRTVRMSTGCRSTVKRNLAPGFETSSWAQTNLDVRLGPAILSATSSLTSSHMNGFCTSEYYRSRNLTGLASDVNSISSCGSWAGGPAENDVGRMSMWSSRMLLTLDL